MENYCSNNYDQDEFVNIEQILNMGQDTASNQDLQGSIERPIFIDLTHDEEAGSSSASIDLTASEEEVGSSRAVPDPSLLIGNVDNERPSTSDTQRTSSVDLDALIRDGGTINGYRVLQRSRFNSVELRRPMNLRDIGATDLATYHVRLHETMNEIATFARQIGGDGSVVSISLRGPSLKSDVTAILSPGNDYDVNVFTDQIEKILQSDDRLLCDDAVKIGATVASNRQGGGRHRRKLTDLALDQDTTTLNIITVAVSVTCVLMSTVTNTLKELYTVPTV
ncbi:putative DNA polymerase-like protein [Triplophysa rosa]|uniref:DNA polymerase-like protein n=1 Tax=Triplophysa rosa TaxID=992332 RepID=A0A9W7T280_TRIRA|nr:putative DNA polymerase-like protein [Triplophysa rosa]